MVDVFFLTQLVFPNKTFGDLIPSPFVTIKLYIKKSIFCGWFVYVFGLGHIVILAMGTWYTCAIRLLIHSYGLDHNYLHTL